MNKIITVLLFGLVFFVSSAVTNEAFIQEIATFMAKDEPEIDKTKLHACALPASEKLSEQEKKTMLHIINEHPDVQQFSKKESEKYLALTVSFFLDVFMCAEMNGE